jgi:hypothetical protein
MAAENAILWLMVSDMMGKDLWAYQNVLTENGVENKFVTFSISYWAG